MNFRRILSKSSLKSSSSTAEKSVCPSEEVSKLQSEVELLKQTIESLKISVESRDAAIGTLAREKEKLYVELKSAQRTNRNIHQQLVDERDIHSKEKDYLIEEIRRLSTKNCYNFTNEFHVQQNILDTQSESSMKDELKSKDEVIYNLCTKYLKIKSSKESLRSKLDKLQQLSQRMCENIIHLLHENRKSLDVIFKKLMNASSITPSSKSYLKLLKINANLHFENTQLKVCLSVKDFSSEQEEESSCKETSPKSHVQEINIIKKSSNIVRKPRFKGNLYHQIHRKPCKLHRLEEMRKFCSIHMMLAPYFRRKKHYSSEPSLSNFTY